MKTTQEKMEQLVRVSEGLPCVFTAQSQEEYAEAKALAKQYDKQKIDVALAIEVRDRERRLRQQKKKVKTLSAAPLTEKFSDDSIESTDT